MSRVMVGRMPWDYAAVEPLPVDQYLRSPTELALAMLQHNVEAFARRVESATVSAMVSACSSFPLGSLLTLP